MKTRKKVKAQIPKCEPPMPKFKLLRLVPLIFVIAAAALLLLNLTKFNGLVGIIQAMSLNLIILAVFAQVFSYLGSGYLIKIIMNRDKFRLSIGRATLVTLAGESMILAGGLASSIAATYYWVSKGGVASGKSVMAGILPTLFNTIVLIIMSIFGMVYVLFGHELSSKQNVLYGVILVIILAFIALSIYGLKNREKMKRLIQWIVSRINRLLKRKHDFTAFGEKIDQFFDEMKLLGSHGWIRVVLGPVLNILFDMLTLYLIFNAAGYLIEPDVLVAGYGLSFLLGRVAFFIPGGAGVVEGSMVAVYTNLEIPANIAIVVVLAYRFVSFWLPGLLGFAAMFYLHRTARRQ